jgi:hypothetical protein
MHCAICGTDHDIDQMELSFRRPDEVAILPADERNARVAENDDLAVIEDSRFFVRAVLPIPVLGRERPYNIGIWVELPKASFARIYSLWDDPEQHLHPAFRVQLANSIPNLPATLQLPASLQLTGPQTRPTVKLEPGNHQLCLEQTAGVTAHRAIEYSSLFS